MHVSRLGVRLAVRVGEQRYLATGHATRANAKLMFIAAALANRLAIATVIAAFTITTRANHIAVICKAQIGALAVSPTLVAVVTLFA